MAKVRLTKQQALNEFKEAILIHINETYERNGTIDRPARCEAWSNYVDSLERAGFITERQASTWTNPF